MKLEYFQKVVGEMFPNLSGISIGEKQYESCLEHREFWDDLINIRFSDVNEIILPFLNKWQCRLPYKCARGLTIALQQSEMLLKPLRSFKIESADFLQQILVQGRKMKILILLQEIFDVISKVKAGRRTVAFTATSKILHMAVPDFFVMADETIRKKYGCEGNGAGYANFMWRMSIFARDLLSQAKGSKRKIIKIPKWRERTLPRLIDNYNYAKYTLMKT